MDDPSRFGELGEARRRILQDRILCTRHNDEPFRSQFLDNQQICRNPVYGAAHGQIDAPRLHHLHEIMTGIDVQRHAYIGLGLGEIGENRQDDFMKGRADCPDRDRPRQTLSNGLEIMTQSTQIGQYLPRVTDSDRPGTRGCQSMGVTLEKLRLKIRLHILQKLRRSRLR